MISFPLYTPCALGWLFFINISFIFYLSKKKKIVHHREHDVQFFFNKSLNTHQKKKKLIVYFNWQCFNRFNFKRVKISNRLVLNGDTRLCYFGVDDTPQILAKNKTPLFQNFWKHYSHAKHGPQLPELVDLTRKH